MVCTPWAATMRAIADGTVEAVRHPATILKGIPLIMLQIFFAKKFVSDRTAVVERGGERKEGAV